MEEDPGEGKNNCDVKHNITPFRSLRLKGLGVKKKVCWHFYEFGELFQEELKWMILFCTAPGAIQLLYIVFQKS